MASGAAKGSKVNSPVMEKNVMINHVKRFYLDLRWLAALLVLSAICAPAQAYPDVTYTLEAAGVDQIQCFALDTFGNACTSKCAGYTPADNNQGTSGALVLARANDIFEPSALSVLVLLVAFAISPFSVIFFLLALERLGLRCHRRSI